MFALAYELHQPVTVVEAMTHRQVLGWYEFFRDRNVNAENGPPSRSAPVAPEEGGIPYSMLSKADKKAMFRNSNGVTTKKTRKKVEA